MRLCRRVRPLPRPRPTPRRAAPASPAVGRPAPLPRGGPPRVARRRCGPCSGGNTTVMCGHRFPGRMGSGAGGSRARLRPDRGPEGVGRPRSARSGRERGMRPSYRHANRAVPGALPNALIPAGARRAAPARPGTAAPAGTGPVAPGRAWVFLARAGAVPAWAGAGTVPARAGGFPSRAGVLPAHGEAEVVPVRAEAAGPPPAIVVEAAGSRRAGRRPRTGGGPGARGRRGRSSPVLTWSPELSRSVPAGPCPRAARLPMKISPRRPVPILDRCHPNVGSWMTKPRFRIQVR